MPSRAYSGQKLVRLVPRNMIAPIPKIRASVPPMTFVKYKTAMATTIRARTMRSTVPMFLVIALILVMLISEFDYA